MKVNEKGRSLTECQDFEKGSQLRNRKRIFEKSKEKDQTQTLRLNLLRVQRWCCSPGRKSWAVKMNWDLRSWIGSREREALNNVKFLYNWIGYVNLLT